MLIRYFGLEGMALTCVPDDSLWTFQVEMMNEEGYDDYGLYLLVNDKKILLRDAESWTGGRELSLYDVGELHEDMVRVISEKLAADPPARLIDLEEIEQDLVKNKYYDLWLEQGKITPDKNGSW